jgi:hypothetical protein
VKDLASPKPASILPKVVFDDPAAALNPSEEEWSQIVQNNLAKFKAEQVKQKQDKFQMSKVIQEEQRKQIQDKLKREKEQAEADRHFFDKFGTKGSDTFFADNEKRLKNLQAMRKGEHDRAVSMSDSYSRQQRQLRERMRKENEERVKVIESMKLEDLAKKQEQLERKKKLREIQEEDLKLKRLTRDNEMQRFSSVDFQEENILSQVYQHKTSKAFEYSKKSEQVQRLIQGKFSPKNKRNFVEEAIERDLRASKTVDEELEKKLAMRKQREMETKKF